MLSIVCWRWGTRYSVDYVNRLQSMLSRNLHIPFQLHCITDDPDGLNDSIVPVPIWPADGLGRCRRLRIFDESMRGLFGDRILQLDIDCIITGDITPLVSRPDPFVIWRSVPEVAYTNGGAIPNSENGKGAYNTSLLLMNTGILSQLWADYLADPIAVESAAKQAGCWTLLQKSIHGKVTSVRPLASGDDDQAVISLYARRLLSPPVWLEQDGVYKVGRRGFKDKTKLPENARIVFFNGSIAELDQECPWVKEHWR